MLLQEQRSHRKVQFANETEAIAPLKTLSDLTNNRNSILCRAKLLISTLATETSLTDRKKHAAQYGSYQQEAQLMLTTGSTRLAVSRGQQTWYHSTCYI